MFTYKFFEALIFENVITLINVSLYFLTVSSAIYRSKAAKLDVTVNDFRA